MESKQKILEALFANLQLDYFNYNRNPRVTSSQGQNIR